MKISKDKTQTIAHVITWVSLPNRDEKILCNKTGTTVL